METTETKIIRIAAALDAARIAAVPIEPVTAAAPELDIDHAYAIQLQNVRTALARGARISGKKIGLTSKAMQEQMGVNEPDYGHLLDSMYLPDGAVAANTLLQPKAEAEIAFVLKADIRGPNATVEDVLAATDYVTPAIEIVDSRITDWRIKLVDTVSDNASSGCYALGRERVPVRGLSLPDASMAFYKNGQKMGEGSGKAVLGDPAYCVAWLANKLWTYGVILKAGEVVLSGALAAAVPAQKGDAFEARFSAPLGTVTAMFL